MVHIFFFLNHHQCFMSIHFFCILIVFRFDSSVPANVNVIFSQLLIISSITWYTIFAYNWLRRWKSLVWTEHCLCSLIVKVFSFIWSIIVDKDGIFVIFDVTWHRRTFSSCFKRLLQNVMIEWFMSKLSHEVMNQQILFQSIVPIFKRLGEYVKKIYSVLWTCLVATLHSQFRSLKYTPRFVQNESVDIKMQLKNIESMYCTSSIGVMMCWVEYLYGRLHNNKTLSIFYGVYSGYALCFATEKMTIYCEYRWKLKKKKTQFKQMKRRLDTF